MKTSEAFSLVEKHLDSLDSEYRGVSALPQLYDLLGYDRFEELYDLFERNEITPNDYADRMIKLINTGKIIALSQKLDNKLAKI